MVPERVAGLFSEFAGTRFAQGLGNAGKNTANDCEPQNNVPIVLPSRYYIPGRGWDLLSGHG